MSLDTFAQSNEVDFGPAARRDDSLPDFEHRFATVDGIRMHYVAGGNPSGEVVVLLAGFPESWFAWRRVMPLLAERFRIIAPDLPGQGDSDRPSSGYDTRTVAARLKAFVDQLGISRCLVAAHDVGAWVAYPFAALFGESLVERLAILDAGIPGITLPDSLPVAPDKAWRTWHFAFHTVADLPEALIEGKERIYLDWFLRRKTANPYTFSEADIDEYLRIFRKDGGLRAGLAFYRDAALSAQQNRALSEQGKLSMPLLAISADQGSIPDMHAPLIPYADAVTGVVIRHSGHFIPEEQPEALAKVLIRFFS